MNPDITIDDHILATIASSASKESDRDLFCCLAEEASELSQAALKYIRAVNQTNPTPKKQDEALQDLIEEFTDVIVAATACQITVDYDIMNQKVERWAKRLREASWASTQEN